MTTCIPHQRHEPYVWVEQVRDVSDSEAAHDYAEIYPLLTKSLSASASASAPEFVRRVQGEEGVCFAFAGAILDPCHDCHDFLCLLLP
jgi:hypothetical protein